MSDEAAVGLFDGAGHVADAAAAMPLLRDKVPLQETWKGVLYGKITLQGCQKIMKINVTYPKNAAPV